MVQYLQQKARGNFTGIMPHSPLMESFVVIFLFTCYRYPGLPPSINVSVCDEA